MFSLIILYFIIIYHVNLPVSKDKNILHFYKYKTIYSYNILSLYYCGFFYPKSAQISAVAILLH